MLTVLLAACTPVVGVKVPTQVLPPSVVAKVPKVPFCTVTSVLSKSLTFSLKLIVTCAVSPAFRVLSLRVMVAVGPWVSTAKLPLAAVPPRLPARSL